MPPGLLRGQVAVGNEILHDGVVTGDAADAVRPDEIGAAVPHVHHFQGLPLQNEAHQGRPHADAGIVCGGLVIDHPVGVLRSGQEQLPRLSGEVRAAQVFQVGAEGLHRQLAGDVPRLGPAHTVADHAPGQAALRNGLIGAGVLVFSSNDPFVSQSPHRNHGESSPFSALIAGPWPAPAGLSGAAGRTRRQCRCPGGGAPWR